MKYGEIAAVVKSEFVKAYNVVLKDGSKKKVKMWNNGKSVTGDVICVIGKGKRNRGHQLTNWYDHYEDWESVSLVGEKTDDEKFKTFMKRVKKAHTMLEKSGLWSDIKDCLNKFIGMDEDYQRQMYSDIVSDSYELFYNQTFTGGKYEWVNCYQMFESFVKEKCFKSISYRSWERQEKNEEVIAAIRDKKEYSNRWHNGYDISLNIMVNEDGYMRGVYSEEYTGCGNGHYYLLLDATHAIFYEDD